MALQSENLAIVDLGILKVRLLFYVSIRCSAQRSHYIRRTVFSVNVKRLQAYARLLCIQTDNVISITDD